MSTIKKSGQPVVKPSMSCAGELPDVRALLEADDRGETLPMSREAIRSLFKRDPTKHSKRY